MGGRCIRYDLGGSVDTLAGWEPSVAGVLGADELPLRVVGGPDGLGGGDFRRQLGDALGRRPARAGAWGRGGRGGGVFRRPRGDALGRRPAAEGAVRAVVVVEGSPHLELGGEVRVL